MKSKYLGYAVALVVGAGLIVGGFRSADEAPQPPAESDLMIDESVPEHRLLQDAVRIDFLRGAGNTRILAYVPKQRPPDLLRINSDGGGHNGAIVDGYSFGEQKLQALVELSATETDTCEQIRDGDFAAENICVRDGDIDAPDLRHVTVYFSGNVNTAPEDGDPETERARRFWATAEMVPPAEAAWFTDLVTRGRAALNR